MAVFESYTQLRQAEDVQDEIYIVSPVDNPVASLSKTIRATGKLHEWTEDVLQAAAANKHVEGADAPADSSAPVVEASANCQIMSKRAQISGTLEEVDKYGRSSELGYQLELRYGEMANDEELAIVGAPGGTRQVGSAGSAGTAREMTALQEQLDASVIVDAATAGAGSTPITTVAELETAIIDAHQATYDHGGSPSYLTTSPANARYIANFAYAAGRQRDLRNERRLVNVIDLIVNPFGELEVILDRNTDDSMCLLDFNYLATPVLRPTADWPLAKTGDSENRQILRESCFAVLNSKSQACVDNIPTSLTIS